MLAPRICSDVKDEYELTIFAFTRFAQNTLAESSYAELTSNL